MDGAEEQRVASNKQHRIKFQKKKNMRSEFVSNPCAGLMSTPSYPLALSSSFFCHQQKQQPPLLPLPEVSPIAKNRKNRSFRDMSNHKPTQSTREEVKKKLPTQTQTQTQMQPIPRFQSTPAVCTSSFRSRNGFGGEMMDWESWVFHLSPPPSSLPVPRFCVTSSKIGCNIAETN